MLLCLSEDDVMKKLFFTLFTIVFIACGDGDLAVESVDFSDASVQSCTDNNSLFFLINGEEALILNVPDNFLTGEETGETPITSQIPGQSQLFYRFYSDVVTQTFFCGEFPPATPIVVDELEATGGTVNLTAQSFIENNTSILVNTLNISNLVLLNTNGERLIDSNFEFGDLIVSTSGTIFNSDNLQICANNPDILYNISGNLAIVLELPSGTITNSDNSPDGTQISIGDATLRFFSFTDPIADDFFCVNPIPDTATSTATNGTVSVVTQEIDVNGTLTFSHAISISDLVLLNGREQQLLGSAVTLGTVSTTN